MSDHARINDLESRIADLMFALTAIREEREQLMHENEMLLTRREAFVGSEPATSARKLLKWAEAHVSALRERFGDREPWHVLRAEMIRDGLACVVVMDEALSSDARILKPEGSQASGSATDRDLCDLRTQIAHLTEEREGALEACSIEAQARAIAEQRLEALTAAHERAKGLVASWRESASREIESGSPEFGDGCDQCADELESALASPRGHSSHESR